MKDEPITEMDLRMPEFQRYDFKLEDLERRGDGKIVRKDRWERGIREIAAIVLGTHSNFEIDDLVAKIRHMRETVRPGGATADECQLIEGLIQLGGYAQAANEKWAKSEQCETEQELIGDALVELVGEENDLQDVMHRRLATLLGLNKPKPEMVALPLPPM